MPASTLLRFGVGAAVGLGGLALFAFLVRPAVEELAGGPIPAGAVLLTQVAVATWAAGLAWVWGRGSAMSGAVVPGAVPAMVHLLLELGLPIG